MNKLLWNTRIISHRSPVIMAILLVIFCFSPAVSAQQSTATITSLTGSAVVTVEGKEIEATLNMILKPGAIIETSTGATAVLKLSEGSQIELVENTRLEVSRLFQEPITEARQSKLKLLWGRIRAFLAPGHQKEGSSFTVNTPNAAVGVQFSQPVIEVSYDPVTKTSVFNVYTVAVTVTNYISGEIEQVPPGNQVIVRDESIFVNPLPSDQVPIPQTDLQEDLQPESQVPSLEEPQTEVGDLPSTTQAPTAGETGHPSISPLRGPLMRQGFSIVRGATSVTVPISVGSVGTGTTSETGEPDGTTTETSTNPSPGTRPERPQKQPAPLTVIFSEE